MFQALFNSLMELIICRFATPFGLTSEYAHPAEILMLGFGTIIGPALTGPHLFTLWLWVSLRVMETVEAHSGYDFPWSPSKFLPLYGGWVALFFLLSASAWLQHSLFAQHLTAYCCYLQCWIPWFSSSRALHPVWKLFINFYLHGLVSEVILLLHILPSDFVIEAFLAINSK